MSLTKKLDLIKIVKDSLTAAGVPGPEVSKPETKQIEEAYVTQQKQYSQVSEFVSQKTKDSHTELYKGYISKLNNISAKLDSVSKDADSNSSDYRSLKIDESYNLNAVWLHELYFANCFDPHSEVYMDSLAFLRLQRDFGTFEDWQKHFVAAGVSAREGWLVLAYNTFLKKYVVALIDGHNQNVMLGLHPVLVIDMWSHSYYRDYLNDKQSYLVAQMREINWGVVEERFKRTEKIAEALK
jgi:Fe-Mn family superoxide dismutase